MKGELQKVVVVGDTEYTIQRFKGEQAFAIKYELSKVIVPFIKELQEAQNASEEERPAKILGAIEHIFANTDYQTALRLLKTLVSQVYDSQNRLIVPNDEFAQNTVSWYMLAWEVILFNYADVFFKARFQYQSRDPEPRVSQGLLAERQRMIDQLSMPVEWAYLLMDDKPLVSYADLKEMSCGEVLDLLEIQACRTLRADMVAEVQRNNIPKT